MSHSISTGVRWTMPMPRIAPIWRVADLRIDSQRLFLSGARRSTAMSIYEYPCLCLSEVAHQHEPVRYQWCGRVLWGWWAECPEHHEHFTSPVWDRKHGQLTRKTAAIQ